MDDLNDSITDFSTSSGSSRSQGTRFMARGQSSCTAAFKYTASHAAEASVELREIIEIEPRFRRLFPYTYFNAVQSQCLDDALYSPHNLVVSAPTGAGKTVLFELAIVRMLASSDGKAARCVYLAPTRALCCERQRDWAGKFTPLGVKCVEFTGDSALPEGERHEMAHLAACDIAVSTPEKWDALTRRWRGATSPMQSIALVLVDEVHTVKGKRGATLEAVASRMRLLNASARFVAVSATVPNIVDIGEWLSGNDAPARVLTFDESYRPVPIEKHVYGYPGDASNAFVFDRNLNYKLRDIIITHSDGKPTLVFCNTRRAALQASESLRESIARQGPLSGVLIDRDCAAASRLTQARYQLHDKRLQALVPHGLAFHHANLTNNDRYIVESLFTEGFLHVICTTSTLAVGVNLPARLVVIKSTLAYGDQGYAEYSDMDIVQMLGRAGRPQFDDRAIAVIMTSESRREYYRTLVEGRSPVESALHDDLCEHLNAEISLGTVSGSESAHTWLASTLLYVRVRKAPEHYGVVGEPTNYLRTLIDTNLRELQGGRLIEPVEGAASSEEHATMRTTRAGEAMARNSVKLATMRRIMELRESETSPRKVFELLTHAQEFAGLRFEQGVKTPLNTLNKHRAIRYPLAGRVASASDKASLLIQAQLGHIAVPECGASVLLATQVKQIMQVAPRIVRAMLECFAMLEQPMSTCYAVALHQSLAARCWEWVAGSGTLLYQLRGIGPQSVQTLVSAGITSLEQLARESVQRIELLLNRNPPYGKELLTQLACLPRFAVTLRRRSGAGHVVDVCVELVSSEKPSPPSNWLYLVLWCKATDGTRAIGNYVALKVLPVRQLLKQRSRYTWSVAVPERVAAHGDLNCLVANDCYVGLDSRATLPAVRTQEPDVVEEELAATSGVRVCLWSDNDDEDGEEGREERVTFSAALDDIPNDAKPQSEAASSGKRTRADADASDLTVVVLPDKIVCTPRNSPFFAKRRIEAYAGAAENTPTRQRGAFAVYDPDGNSAWESLQELEASGALQEDANSSGSSSETPPANPLFRKLCLSRFST